MTLQVLVTCEHAGNRVPEAYERCFAGAGEVLDSHRGWDPGALPLARMLAGALDASLRHSLTSRLLADANRPLGSASLFSEFTRELSPSERGQVLRRYHHRYRARVRHLIDPWVAGGDRILHLGIHTFTPELNGLRRDVQIGVLFDPDRQAEQGFAGRLVRELKAALPHLNVRPNEPYLGVDEGLTTELRSELPRGRYLGIELEVCQSLVHARSRARPEVLAGVRVAVVRAVEAERAEST